MGAYVFYYWSGCQTLLYCAMLFMIGDLVLFIRSVDIFCPFVSIKVFNFISGIEGF